MSRLRIYLCAAAIASANLATAAPKEWTLGECIEYAIEHNISLQQREVNVNQQDISLSNAKNDRLPSLNASLGSNGYFGRGPSRDGTYIDHTQFSTSANLSANMTLYNGGSISNTIKSRELDLQAALQDMEAGREDISLQIVALYMQILYNEELCGVYKNQVELSQSQVDRSKILLDNGRASEGDYLESVATLAKDKLALVEMQGQLKTTLLELAQALNLPVNEEFDVAIPDLTTLDSQSIAPPNNIYEYAIENRPHIKSAELRLRSLEYQQRVAKASGIPRVSLSGGYSNSYFNSLTESAVNAAFREQMRLNSSENIGLSVSVPIFNQFATRNSRRMAQFNIDNQTLAIENSKQQLQKQIEQAYQNAEISAAQYRASEESTQASQKAFEYTNIEMEQGRSTIFDFNESKTRLSRSESELARAKYEYLFNLKILNFYAGKSLY